MNLIVRRRKCSEETVGLFSSLNICLYLARRRTQPQPVKSTTRGQKKKPNNDPPPALSNFSPGSALRWTAVAFAGNIRRLSGRLPLPPLYRRFSDVHPSTLSRAGRVRRLRVYRRIVRPCTFPKRRVCEARRVHCQNRHRSICKTTGRPVWRPPRRQNPSVVAADCP